MHKEVCEEVSKEIPYNEEEDKVQWETKEAQAKALKDVLGLIDEKMQDLGKYGEGELYMKCMFKALTELKSKIEG